MPDNTTTKNEINLLGKLTAGVLLIFLTSAAIYLIIAYWPNKMPPIKDGDDAAWYKNQCFNVTLIEKNDCSLMQENDSLYRIQDSIEKKIISFKDSIKVKQDTVQLVMLKDSVKNAENSLVYLKKNIISISDVKKIHLNTILLLLVALMGFLGNMVHVATSFTTFVGMGTFQCNWVLWYFVKPFTAAALAIILYFIIRAGFLSYGSSASGINLFGILSFSALAGLFTDSATLKLKEVFEVIFKPKDERTGRLEGDEFSVSSFSPETIPATAESNLVITGKNLNLPDLKITIDGNVVTPVTKTTNKLEIKYTPTTGAAKAILVIADRAGKQLYKKEIGIK